VCRLLSRHIGASLLDLEKTAAVIDARIRLPRSDALTLLDEATARVSQLQDQSFAKTVLSQHLLRPTAVLNPGAQVPSTEMCAHPV
jgi:hypothetical protein